MHKIFTLFFSMCLVLTFSIGFNVFAQESKIQQRNNLKPKDKPNPPKEEPKKYVAPKKTPTATPKPRVKKTRSTPKPRAQTKRNRNINLIDITISTPEPEQEILLGKEILGISDENSKFETSMKKGNYLLSFRNKETEDVLGSQLVSISNENKEFALLIEVPEEDDRSDEPTAEQFLQDQLKEALDAAERIKDILIRYGDPLKTNTVTLSDWEFVYQSAQANSLKNFTAIQIEAQRWFSSGQIDLAKGNYANAYGNFNKAIEYMPDSAYPYYALGEAYTANKQGGDALTAYQKAVQINPKFALAHRKIGDIHLSSNRSKEAIISLETALANGFDTPAVRFDLGKAYLKNKDWDKSSKELELVVKEAPTGDVYMTLGDLYIELKRNISAYESYKKSTELSPESAKAYYKLGEILFNEREYEKAKSAFEQSLILDEKGKQINVNQAKKLVRESAQKLK